MDCGKGEGGSVVGVGGVVVAGDGGSMVGCGGGGGGGGYGLQDPEVGGGWWVGGD